MPNRDLPHLLGEVRGLTERYMAGDPDSFTAFRDLASLLLSLTVLAPYGGVRLASGPRADARVLGGWRGPGDPLPLNDGCFLKISVTLFLAETPAGHRLKVEKSVYQYQIDQEGDRWVFRYDYLRIPPEPHPGAHFQVRGQLAEGACLPPGIPLERVHFPTMRVSLEAVIRLLADQFMVPCNAAGVWRPVLAESERLFYEIAHQPAR